MPQWGVQENHGAEEHRQVDRALLSLDRVRATAIPTIIWFRRRSDVSPENDGTLKVE